MRWLALWIFSAVVVAAGQSTPIERNPYVRNIAPVLARDVPEIGQAAYNGNLDVLRHLIASGTNLEANGTDGRAPLLLAAASGHLEAVTVLLEAGANVNARDRAGATALHWATRRGEDKIALLLLAHHSEVNIQDDAGETPLILAAVAGNKNVVEALISLGAKQDVSDRFGFTAEDYAKRNGYNDITSLLKTGR